jgi:hypothetical protein
MKDFDILRSCHDTKYYRSVILYWCWAFGGLLRGNEHLRGKARPDPIDWSILAPILTDLAAAQELVEALTVDKFPSRACNYLTLSVSDRVDHTRYLISIEV